MAAEKLTRVQLKSLGLNFRFFGRAEVKRLSRILRRDEAVKHCIYGFCGDGPVLLVATDQRMLIVDKRFLFMNLDSFAYDRISDLEFKKGALAASIVITVGPRSVHFKTYADARLRKLNKYVSEARKPHQTMAIMEGIGLKEDRNWSVPVELRRPSME